MVMPFYEGPTLKTALAELGHVPSEGELRTWLRPLLDALTVMHAAQCYHRDIAPDNILLTPSGPLLLDFGAARRVIGDMTHALTVVLKPGYAPIEQYGDVASMTQGAWTDLYALACVVYYAITGKTPMSSVERLMDDRLQPISASAAGRYSPAFLGAIDAALSVRPQDRPQDAQQFRALLDADLPPEPMLAPGPGNPVSHEAFSQTEKHDGYSTVPGTLTPVLSTQLLTRPTERHDAPVAADEAAARASVGLASAPVPLARSGPPSQFPATARLVREADALPVLPAVQVAPATARPPARFGAVAAGAIVLVVGLGAAFWWVQQRDATGPAPAAEPAASAAPPAVQAAPSAVAPAIVPATSAAAQASPVATTAASAPAAASAATALPPPSTAVPAVVEPRTNASAQPAQTLPRVVPHDTATTPATSTPTRTRREPTASRPDAVTTPRPRTSSIGSRCSDILQKASLEPLTGEEAAYLKRECR
jgi:hypothetical protein